MAQNRRAKRTRRQSKRLHKFRRHLSRRAGTALHTQTGGNNDLKRIVYYSCFFGPSGNVGDVIPERPSTIHDCFFFSNNDETIKKAAEKGWTTVRDQTPVKDSYRDNSVDSKELKACPHHYSQLRGYTYTCYFDSKLAVHEKDVLEFLPTLSGDVVMTLNNHPFIKHAVWDEFKACMDQPRYAQDADTYRRYIEQKLKEGYKDTADQHYETSFILRKSGPTADAIGEDWLHDIRQTGAECQITFFFIQQKYNKHIRPLPRYYAQR